MSPERKFTSGTHVVTEYYWAKEMVVYLDGTAFKGSYDDACKIAARRSGEDLIREAPSHV